MRILRVKIRIGVWVYSGAEFVSRAGLFGWGSGSGRVRA